TVNKRKSTPLGIGIPMESRMLRSSTPHGPYAISEARILRMSNDVREGFSQFVEPGVAQHEHYRRQQTESPQGTQPRSMIVQEDVAVAAHQDVDWILLCHRQQVCGQ